jgi:signal transduction histidine kinase
MTSGVRKIPVLRYCLIILLLCILIIGVLYLMLRYKKAHKLQSSIENLISARENSSLIDSCIINLYSADNNSRLYTITGNNLYLKKFSNDIGKISTAIDRIKFDKKQISDLDPSKFKELMQQKAEKTGSYIKLRLLTDSLIKYSVKVNHSLKNLASQTKPVVNVQHVVTIDTVIKQQQDSKPKKKLFGRIIAAISNSKDEKQAPVIVKIKKDTLTTTTYAAKDSVLTHKTSFKNYYKKLNTANDELRKNEHQVLMINDHLINEIIGSLRLYKSIEQLYIDKSKNELQENVSTLFDEFSRISKLSILFLIVLAVILFYNIWKIFRNEQEIIEYSEKTQSYALSKSKFLAGMSHEIRTPLNSVIGFSEQLSQADLQPEQKEQIDAIRNSSEMLLELVNEILDFSKYETGKMSFENTPFILSQVMDDVFNGMNIHALKKKLYLENQITIDNDICCEGDKMRLKQVIMNLLGNAIKFTVKGRVTLKANIEQQPGDTILLKVMVKDTGLGIDKNDLPNIFEEFSQVAMAQKATRHKGTGLGLAICKKIIELQGGKISVTSTPGEGSAFSFELPLKKCELPEIQEVQSLSNELMAELVKDKYILFAEDNQLNVLLGSTILKKWKIRYDIAYTGHEALQLHKKNKYDMILTDIQMPEMNGLELTEIIRNTPNDAKSNIPIMALTANVMKEDRDIYYKAGINDVILKPFLEKNLVEKIALAVLNDITVLRFVS